MAGTCTSTAARQAAAGAGRVVLPDHRGAEAGRRLGRSLADVAGGRHPAGEEGHSEVAAGGVEVHEQRGSDDQPPRQQVGDALGRTAVGTPREGPREVAPVDRADAGAGLEGELVGDGHRPQFAVHALAPQRGEQHAHGCDAFQLVAVHPAEHGEHRTRAVADAAQIDADAVARDPLDLGLRKQRRTRPLLLALPAAHAWRADTEGSHDSARRGAETLALAPASVN